MRPALFDDIGTRATGAPGLAAHVASVRPLKTDNAFMQAIAEISPVAGRIVYSHPMGPLIAGAFIDKLRTAGAMTMLSHAGVSIAPSEQF